MIRAEFTGVVKQRNVGSLGWAGVPRRQYLLGLRGIITRLGRGCSLTLLGSAALFSQNFSVCSSQEHLNYYFQLLAALEYNMQTIASQKKTLDMLVDLCIEVRLL